MCFNEPFPCIYKQTVGRLCMRLLNNLAAHPSIKRIEKRVHVHDMYMCNGPKRLLMRPKKKNTLLNSLLKDYMIPLRLGVLALAASFTVGERSQPASS